MLFLAEQGASRLMIGEQRCALLINFRIKFNLIFAGAPSIRSLVAVLSMLLFSTNSNVMCAFYSGPVLTGVRVYVIFSGSFVVAHSYTEKRAPETHCDGKNCKRGFKMYRAKCDVSVSALNRSLKGV